MISGAKLLGTQSKPLYSTEARTMVDIEVLQRLRVQSCHHSSTATSAPLDHSTFHLLLPLLKEAAHSLPLIGKHKRSAKKQIPLLGEFRLLQHGRYGYLLKTWACSISVLSRDRTCGTLEATDGTGGGGGGVRNRPLVFQPSDRGIGNCKLYIGWGRVLWDGGFWCLVLLWAES